MVGMKKKRTPKERPFHLELGELRRRTEQDAAPSRGTSGVELRIETDAHRALLRELARAALVGMALSACTPKRKEPEPVAERSPAADASSPPADSTVGPVREPSPRRERNPDDVDVAGWRPVPLGRGACTLYVAPSPETLFGPLPMTSCTGRAGCQEFVPSWATERGDSLFYAMHPRSGYTQFEASRRRGAREELEVKLTVLTSPAGQAVFGMASRGGAECAANVAMSDDGFALGVVASGTTWAHFATAKWSSPQELTWVAADAVDLAKVRAVERYPSLRAFTPDGLWLGEDAGFSLLTPANGRLRGMPMARPGGSYPGRYVTVTGGVVASWYTAGHAAEDGLVLVDPMLVPHELVGRRKGIGVEKLAAESADTVVWIEREEGRCRLFRAVVARSATGFRPHEVTSLPGNCSLLRGSMVANAGVAVHVAGDPSVHDHGEVQIVELDSGLGWRVPPFDGLTWGIPTAVTPDAIWLTTREKARQVDGVWRNGVRPRLVRLERGRLGTSRSLR